MSTPELLLLSSPPLGSHPNAGIFFGGVLAFCGVALTALVAWSNGRGTRDASLQADVTERLRTLMAELGADRARQAARVLEQDHELDLLRDRLGDAHRDRLELSGEITNLRQAAESRLRLEERASTSPIPPDSLVRKQPDSEGGQDI